MNKIAFITLGCKLNYAETSTYERGFLRNGFEVVPWSEKADVYLVNTCTVTEHSDKKCRNIIRKVHKVSPDAAIIVTGCYAELSREEIQSIKGVSLVFGAKQKAQVVPDTLALLGRDTENDSVQTGTADQGTFAAYSSGERTRSFLKIQDGCNNFCAYCTVPFARGESRNIPICEVLKQAREIAADGSRR
jgi:threonylcarbamoyladenosine tRNA methylthiotransferase MtaB